jgi:spore coat protein JB
MNNFDCNDMKQNEMLCKIKEYQFSIIELALYLDTHPEDEKALCLHREYTRRLKDLRDKYQKVYGPLTIEYPCNKWRWLEEPWPWERGNF